MEWIDYGLGALRARRWTRPASAGPRRDLRRGSPRRGELAGYEATERFYEIGTPAALAETDAFLLGSPALKRAIVPVIALLVAAFLVVTVVGLVGDLPDVEWQIAPVWIAVSVALFIAFQGLHAEELWRRLLGAAGGHVDALDGQPSSRSPCSRGTSPPRCCWR